MRIYPSQTCLSACARPAERCRFELCREVGVQQQRHRTASHGKSSSSTKMSSIGSLRARYASVPPLHFATKTPRRIYALAGFTAVQKAVSPCPLCSYISMSVVAAAARPLPLSFPVCSRCFPGAELIFQALRKFQNSNFENRHHRENMCKRSDPTADVEHALR